MIQSTKYWAVNLSKYARAALCRAKAYQSRKRDGALFSTSYELEARILQTAKMDSIITYCISKKLSTKAAPGVYALIQNFAQSLKVHITIQTTTWHYIGGLFRIGDSRYYICQKK